MLKKTVHLDQRYPRAIFSAISIDTRLTLNNSSNGIGASRPCSTACTKAAAHSLLSLVLAPEIHLTKSWPAKALKSAVVVQLQDASTGKNFQPLFRKGLVAIGQIVDSADGTVLKTQGNAGLVFGNDRTR